MDTTAEIRRDLVNAINLEPGSRTSLEVMHGQVWNTDELSADFSVRGFAAPFIVVTRKSDGRSGSLMFQHSPRFYFGFVEDKE